MTDVNSYTAEMILKFILGIEPLGRFDSYVSKVKELGINEAVKITQDAYDRYMSINSVRESKTVILLPSR